MTAGHPPGPLSLVQATCVLVGAGAVLIRGAPGSGKSSLAAALIARDNPRCLVRLVADDAVRVSARGGRLVALAPQPTRGLIEMRGLGILETEHEARAVVRLVVDLEPGGDVERLPEAKSARVQIAGVDIPRIVLPPNDPASADRVMTALGRRGTNSPACAKTNSLDRSGRIRA